MLIPYFSYVRDLEDKVRRLQEATAAQVTDRGINQMTGYTSQLAWAPPDEPMSLRASTTPAVPSVSGRHPDRAAKMPEERLVMDPLSPTRDVGDDLLRHFGMRAGPADSMSRDSSPPPSTSRDASHDTHGHGKSQPAGIGNASTRRKTQVPPSVEQLINRLPLSQYLPTPNSPDNDQLFPWAVVSDLEPSCDDAEEARSGLPDDSRLDEMIQRFLDYFNSAFSIFHEGGLRQLVERFRRAPVVSPFDAFVVYSMSCRSQNVYYETENNTVILAIATSSMTRGPDSHSFKLRKQQQCKQYS